MPIPAFRDDGYLPDGLYQASEQEVIARFGQSTPRRIYLAGRVRSWLDLARAVGARRFVIDGSFITDKAEPGDVDAVVWLPDDWAEQVRMGKPEALELWEMLRTRQPEELFAVRRAGPWQAWVDFFGAIRHSAGRKGVVEIWL
jgi:hypothetical protein